MVKIISTYQGQLHCKATHEPSGSHLETDAPKDNNGLGENFSPTDLVATALGTCILTTIAIFAKRDLIELGPANITVYKEMSSSGPRKISSLKTILELSKNIPVDFQLKIENIANSCPVKKSLSSDILMPIEISYCL